MKPDSDSDRSHESVINDTLARFLRERSGLTLTTAGMEMLRSLRFGVWTHQSTRACPQSQMPGFLLNQAVIISRSGLSQERFKSREMSGITHSRSWRYARAYGH